MLVLSIDRCCLFNPCCCLCRLFVQDYLGGNGLAAQDTDNRWLITNVGYTSSGSLVYNFDFQYTEYIGNVAPTGDCNLFTTLASAQQAQAVTTSLIPNLQSRWLVHTYVGLLEDMCHIAVSFRCGWTLICTLIQIRRHIKMDFRFKNHIHMYFITTQYLWNNAFVEDIDVVCDH